MVIGANPAAAHPVFNSRMKQALRRGAKLIVVDPRVTETVKSAHVEADYHLQLLPGTNVAVINALAHVVATEGLMDREFINSRCDLEAFAETLIHEAISVVNKRYMGDNNREDMEVRRCVEDLKKHFGVE